MNLTIQALSTTGVPGILPNHKQINQAITARIQNSVVQRKVFMFVFVKKIKI